MRIEFVHAEVMHMVIGDRDRSVEKAVDLGIKAGIEFERDRIRSILDLSAPLGLEKAVRMLAFHPSSTAESVSAFTATCPAGPEQAAEFRKMFRLVDTTPAIEESQNAG